MSHPDITNEMVIRQQKAMTVMNVEYLPAIQEEQLKNTIYHKFSLVDMSALGVAFEPLVQGIHMIISGGAGTSGLYYVNTKGLQMAQFKNGSGFLGSLLTENGAVGGGQAVISPLACNPAMLFMAAALMNIEKKLGDIKELQEEILDYLKSKDKAKIRGDINVLSDIMDNYKFNWDNEKYKTNKHILVQDIRKDAEQGILLFRDQIRKRLTKRGAIHSDQEVKGMLEKLQAQFKDYQLALYLYAYAAFLEVMLLENFDAGFLDSTSQRIEDYAFQYRELYTGCYNQIEGLSEASLQSRAVKKLSAASKAAGNAIAKIPVISRGQVDERLINMGEKLGEKNIGKTREAMKRLVGSADSCTSVFSENIKLVSRIYNLSMDVLFDSENVYLLEGES